MVTRIGIVLAAVACSQGEQEPPASAREPIVGAMQSVGDALARDQRTGPPGPSRELRDSLGLDGKDAPTLPAHLATRFAVVVTDQDAPVAVHAFPTEIHVYRVAGGKVTLESKHALEPDHVVMSWAWRDKHELVLLIGKHTGEALEPSLRRIVNGKLESVAWPDKKHFKASKPMRRFDHVIATASNEVWLNLCRAWQARDPHDCTDHVSVRVAPPASRAGARPPERREVVGLAPLPGWSLTVKPRASRKTGPLACRGPQGIAATVAPTDAHSFGFRSELRWLSHHPPIQYVEEEIGGEDDQANVVVGVDRHFLAGCKLVDGYLYLVEVYANGFWSVHDGDAENTRRGATSVMWHGRILVTLPGADLIAFAP